MFEIDGIIFDWDEGKYEDNLRKHNIDFREAATVFGDGSSMYSYDEKHSRNEGRFIIIGMSKQFNILMVCHCYRNDDSIIRLISARKANKKEMSQYWRQL